MHPKTVHLRRRSTTDPSVSPPCLFLTQQRLEVVLIPSGGVYRRPVEIYTAGRNKHNSKAIDEHCSKMSGPSRRRCVPGFSVHPLLVNDFGRRGKCKLSANTAARDNLIGGREQARRA